MGVWNEEWIVLPDGVCRIGDDYGELKIYFYIQFVVLNKGYLKIKSVLFAG